MGFHDPQEVSRQMDHTTNLYYLVDCPVSESIKLDAGKSNMINDLFLCQEMSRLLYSVDTLPDFGLARRFGRRDLIEPAPL